MLLWRSSYEALKQFVYRLTLVAGCPAARQLRTLAEQRPDVA